MFQKFPSPNQLKYLMGDFSKVSTLPKQQLLLDTFFYKFKYICPIYTIVQQDTLCEYPD
jgi:hypothetical protein